MKKVLSILLVLAMVFALAACGTPANNTANTNSGTNASNNAGSNTNNAAGSNASENTNTADGPKSVTYAEFAAAKADSDIVVEGYLQGWAYSSQYGNAGLFIMNDDGNFYAYRAKCDDATAAKFAEGVKVRITGQKAYWEGFHEIAEGATIEVLEGNKIYPAVEVGKDIIDIDAMTKLQGARVALKGATVVAADTKVDDKEVAFLYNWDGSGSAGSNNDLYINITLPGIADEHFTVVVESDEIAEGSDTYKAATELNIGDVIDIEGFMYWYNGPQVHIHKISKVGADKTVSGEGFTYKEFAEAATDSDVIVEGYLQGWAYNAQYKNAGLFIMNDDGNFYAYRAACDDALAAKFAEGVKVRVTGQKAFWEGFHEIAEGAEIEILDGNKIYPAVDVSKNLDKIDDMTKLQGARVSVSGAKVVAQKDAAGKDAAFLYNWDGSGAAGSNSDLYLKLQIEGTEGEYTVVVESDEVPEGSDVYKAVTELAADAVVDIEGFMYWYNGPQIHVHSIAVK